MLRFIFPLVILLSLLSECYAKCCKNVKPLCVGGVDCTPNCSDGVSQCDCPGACLNDGWGGCNTNYKCTVTIIESSIVENSFPTTTSIYYYSTSTYYYSTYSAIQVVTAQSTNIVTSTITQTITSTAYVTIPGAQATVSQRARIRRVVPQEAQEYRHLQHPRQDRSTVYSTVIVTATGNYCNQPGLLPCTAVNSQVYTQSAIYTTSVQSTYYQNVPSTAYVTAESTQVVTSTYTAPGNTVTVAGSTSSSKTPTTSTSSTQTTTTAAGVSAAALTSSSAASSSRPTTTAPATVTVTAKGEGAIVAPNAGGFLGICNLILWQFLNHAM